jgi:RimJ/RimL family protein N-acetyltransferase
MPEAVRAVIRFGFGRMRLNRLEARCVAENTAFARVRSYSYKNARVPLPGCP